MTVEQASPSRRFQGSPERTVAAHPLRAERSAGAVLASPAAPARHAARTLRLAQIFLGPHHWAAGWLARLLHAWPGFADHLLDQTPGYVHYLCIVALHAERLPEVAPKVLARWLAGTARREVLATLGIAEGPGLLSILDRLPSPGRPRRVYADLLAVLPEPIGGRALRHLRNVTGARLALLRQLPAELRSVPWLLFSRGTQRQVHGDVGEVKQLLAALAPDRRSAALDALHRVRDRTGFCRWYDRWKRDLTFPPPPWPGTRRLRPIPTARELVATAREFRNCLEYCIDEAISGQRCYYRWHSAGPGVVVEVERRKGRWVVAQMAGPRNATPRARLRRRVLATLADAGIGPAPPDMAEAHDVRGPEWE